MRSRSDIIGSIESIAILEVSVPKNREIACQRWDRVPSEMLSALSQFVHLTHRPVRFTSLPVAASANAMCQSAKGIPAAGNVR